MSPATRSSRFGSAHHHDAARASISFRLTRECDCLPNCWRSLGVTGPSTEPPGRPPVDSSDGRDVAAELAGQPEVQHRQLDQKSLGHTVFPASKQ